MSPMGEGDADRLTQQVTHILRSAGFTITEDPVTKAPDVVTRPFGEGYGYTTIAVLSESHCAIHTYPEDCYDRVAEVEFNLCYLARDHSANLEAARQLFGELFEPEVKVEVVHSEKRFFLPFADAQAA